MPNRITPVQTNYQSAVLNALTARTIFSAASNTLGNKICSASAFEVNGSLGIGHFVIATGAPSLMTDGVVVSTIVSAGVGTANDRYVSKIDKEIFVPVGYGLYWISSATSVVTTTDVSWGPA